MAQTLTAKTLEGADGANFSVPFNVESANSYNYPLVQMVPGDLGGLSVYNFISAATTNSTSIKTSAGMVYGVHITNIDDSVVYLKFYDKASAPTVGTDTIKFVVGCPVAAVDADGASVDPFWPQGITFSTGIGCGLVSAITDTTTAVGADKIQVTIYYK